MDDSDELRQNPQEEGASEEYSLEIDSIVNMDQFKALECTLDDLHDISHIASNFMISDCGKYICKARIERKGVAEEIGVDMHNPQPLNFKKLDKYLKMREVYEQRIIDEAMIVVTTCHSSQSKRLKDFVFNKVIVDEAAQAQEIEIVKTCLRAEQLVLIGDHKQLGPIYAINVPKCDSMFARLMEAKYPCSVMLTDCFRMHPALLTIPNTLFYNG